MPHVIGDTFIVERSGKAFDAKDRVPIILAHGRAFGSGEHETTRSCLEELEKLPFGAGTRVLDLGCGTGILAIAAAKMGAGPVIALDPSWRAIQTTCEGVRLNGLNSSVMMIQGDIRAIGGVRFDLVMANLYGDILVQIAPAVSSLLKDGAYLLLSGISYEFTDEIKGGFLGENCRLITSRYMSEYITLLFQRSEVKGRRF